MFKLLGKIIVEQSKAQVMVFVIEVLIKTLQTFQHERTNQSHLRDALEDVATVGNESIMPDTKKSSLLSKLLKI